MALADGPRATSFLTGEDDELESGISEVQQRRNPDRKTPRSIRYHSALGTRHLALGTWPSPSMRGIDRYSSAVVFALVHEPIAWTATGVNENRMRAATASIAAES